MPRHNANTFGQVPEAARVTVHISSAVGRDRKRNATYTVYGANGAEVAERIRDLLESAYTPPQNSDEEENDPAPRRRIKKVRRVRS